MLHLTSLAVTALPRMLMWTRRFDEHARQAGYSSMRELQRRWDTQRTKIERRARIQIT